MTILPDFLVQNFRTRLEELYVRAENVFIGWSFDRAILSFDLRGRVLGCFEVRRGIPLIRLHEEFCMYEYDNMLNDTLPHEVAHHLVYEVYEHTLPGEWRKSRRKSHGVEWQAIATILGAKSEAKCRSGYESVRCAKTGRLRPLAAINAERELEIVALKNKIEQLTKKE